MILEIPADKLISLIEKQLNNLFLYDFETEHSLLISGVNKALKKCEFCFSHTNNKYYRKNNQVYFNPFNSNQYSIFLYYLSYALGHVDNSTLADRIYYLNKTLNGLDLYYQVRMPDIFYLSHPVGAVIGRAEFGEGFSFKQNCTVGNNKGIFPIFGKHVRMMSGSKVLGRCTVGDNVIISANTFVKDQNIPDNKIVFGASPNLIIKDITRDYSMYE